VRLVKTRAGCAAISTLLKEKCKPLMPVIRPSLKPQLVLFYERGKSRGPKGSRLLLSAYLNRAALTGDKKSTFFWFFSFCFGKEKNIKNINLKTKNYSRL